MNGSLKLPLLIALALASTQVQAVDLGRVQVKSALGQPLLVEIPVQAATPAELQHLTAQLASSDDFARAGIVDGRTTIPLQFTVANASSGQRVIRITSAVAVEDPLLDLLVEVHTPAGKSVREFTILLDPPSTPAVAGPAATRQMQPATTAQPHVSAATPAQARVQPAAKAGARPATGTPSGLATAPAAGQPSGSVTVARGQTLSSIARDAAPANVDVRQMLLAIKQANPEAFYRDNINALKTGAILRMPTATEAQAVALAAAIAEVRRQNDDWSAKAPANPAVVADAATRLTASSGPTRTSSDTHDRLALVPAKDAGAGGGKGAGDAAGSKAGEAAATLKQNLLRTQESLASVQQQTGDLKARLKDLTDINDKNTRLLSLKDSEIAELQTKLAAARAPGGAPQADDSSKLRPTAGPARPAESATATVAAASSAVVPAVSGSAAVATVPAVAATAPATPVPAATATSATAASGKFVPSPAVAPPAVKPAQAPQPAHQPAAVGALPWYMQTWAWAAAGGAAILLLLLLLLGRRRKPVTEVASGKSASSLADRFGTPQGSPTAPADASTADDVDQNELLDQLAEHPDDIGLHLELATLYYSRRDVEHFEAAVEAMHAHITDPQQDEWQDVVHMGEDLVPAHPLFDHHAELPVHTGNDDDPLQGFNIDDYANDAPATGPSADLAAGSAPPELPKPVGGYAYNFDLTAQSQPPAAPSNPAAMDDLAASSAPDEAVQPAATAAFAVDDTESSWQFADTDATPAAGATRELGEFNDDPVDTQLDLARAYLDMGDDEGARAMLDEVIRAGSQTQQDIAKELLGGLSK